MLLGWELLYTPPLSSQMRGVTANSASQGIMLQGVLSNTMHYYVRVKKVEYLSEDKVIEILWQSVKRGQCWEIRNNMDYFPNDLVHLGENVLGGKDVLNSLPDFNVDVHQKVREVCNNGLRPIISREKGLRFSLRFWVTISVRRPKSYTKEGFLTYDFQNRVYDFLYDFGRYHTQLWSMVRPYNLNQSIGRIPPSHQ